MHPPGIDFSTEKKSIAVASLCITEEMRERDLFVLTFGERWIRMTVS